jgi:hypothetical protein
VATDLIDVRRLTLLRTPERISEGLGFRHITIVEIAEREEAVA